MPKQLKDVPETLRPYLFHGIDLSWQNGDKEAIADCPWCGSEGHFSVNLQKGVWKCWKCAEGTEKGGGNPYVFLRMLWQQSDERTSLADYTELATTRGLLHSDTVMRWGLSVSTLTGDWLIPGYSVVSGNLMQLYRYVAGSTRNLLLSTSEIGHQMFGVNLYDANKPVVFLCEGPWDALALWEMLGQVKDVDGKLVPTANVDASLLGESSVLGVPGSNTFFDEWLPLFADKTVNLMYDSDHPRKHPKTGKITAPAGYHGMRRTAGILSSAENPPSEINHLCWGPEGYDSELPSGYDVGDCLNA